MLLHPGNQNPITRTSIAPKVSEDVSKEYATYLKQPALGEPGNPGSKSAQGLAAHVFDLTGAAYFHMVRQNQSQTIVLSGEAGSGKSESHKLIAQNLCDISRFRKRKSKVHSLSLKVDTIVSAFGCAHSSATSKNSSRFGRFSEFQFDDAGNMTGLKTLHYLLDTDRVCSVGADDKNYNIFYQLFAGTSSEEKAQLHLTDPSAHHYLSQSKVKSSSSSVPSSQDAAAYEELREVLKSFGVTKRQHSSILSLLAGILHLGNIQFVNDARNFEQCSIRNPEQLMIAAEVLGVEPGILHQTLVNRTILVKEELCSVLLNAESATAQRDGLAKTLYSLLFDWIMETVNSKLDSSNNSQLKNVIGVIDFPGFNIGHDKVPSASLHHLLVNYANERLFSFMNQDLVTMAASIFKAEQIPFPVLSSTAASIQASGQVLSLLASSSSQLGILPIIESFSAKSSSNSQQVNGGEARLLDTQAIDQIYDTHSASAASISGGEAAPHFVMTKRNRRRFGVKHYAGKVEYCADGWIEKNNGLYSTDAIMLFRGSSDIPASSNTFIRQLFSHNKVVSSMPHPRASKNIVAAVPAASLKPTLLNLNSSTAAATAALSSDEDEEAIVKTVSGRLRRSLEELLAACSLTRLWFVMHVRPSENINIGGAYEFAPVFEDNCVKRQVALAGLAEMTINPAPLYTASFKYEEFADKFERVLPDFFNTDSNSTIQSLCARMAEKYGWESKDIALGSKSVFLSEQAWRALDDHLRGVEEQDSKKATPNSDEGVAENFADNTVENTPNGSRRNSVTSTNSRLSISGRPARLFTNQNYPESEAGDEDLRDYASAMTDDDTSQYYSKTNGKAFLNHRTSSILNEKAAVTPDMENSKAALAAGGVGAVIAKPIPAAAEKPPKRKQTRARKQWVCLTWSLTFCCLPICLSKCGKMRRKDIQMAWREKVTLNLIIFAMCCSMMFFIIGLGTLICPDKKLLSIGELGAFASTPSNPEPKYPYLAIQDSWYKIDNWVQDHTSKGYVSLPALQNTVYGQDVSAMFVASKSNVWDRYCGLKKPNTGWTPFVQPQLSKSIQNIWHSHQKLGSGFIGIDYIDSMKKERRGFLTYNNTGIVSTLIGDDPTKFIIVAYGNIIDMSNYVNNNNTFNGGFLGKEIYDLAAKFGNKGSDVTDAMNVIKAKDRDFGAKYTCMINLMRIGVIDTRSSPQCLFSNYVLLAATVLLCVVIGFKFLGALQLASRRNPEDHDKFVILQVPCYTEGAESLAKTFESLANTNYDDRRKLLFVICDGMIIGSGNDRPTPRIALDLLGVPHSVDPEPKLFHSLGEGNKQVNMAKVYSGLYEATGRKVPFIVVVKVGKPSERSRPGNRGKRDSQMILMKFLNNSHFNNPMSPLELEVYHHMKNIIGIEPRFFEYALMVDADTEVLPDSLNRMIAVMIRDSRVIGLCGETLISNEGDTWVTMMQVYEYFISHHMAKAFESLFGTVTCLPGCFCMYRLRAPASDGRDIPILMSNEIIREYSDNEVDTLHKKNLLHLGEDRYLTTLMLKHFPQYKLSFTVDAKCRTNVPDRWPVFLSQRRRWINSTVHNLFELLMLPQLCGFLFFSMRFLVFLDLFATLVQPAGLFYVGYLVYSVLSQDFPTIPQTALIMIGCIYGLQLVIIILKREWQNIGWMLIYIIFMPFWAVYLPVYSFWHFDDFSWGNTRVVLGDQGKKIYAVDVEELEITHIPEQKWSDYEAQMMATQLQQQQQQLTMADHVSVYSGIVPVGMPQVYAGSVIMGGSQYSVGVPIVEGNDQSWASGAVRRPISQYGGSVVSMRPGSGNSQRSGAVDTGNGRPASIKSTASGKSATGNGGGGGGHVQLPPDEVLLDELHSILATSNLQNTTKRQLREELSRRFGSIDLTRKRDWLNKKIDEMVGN